MASLGVVAASCGGDTEPAASDQLPALTVIGLADGEASRLDTPAAAPQVINLWATWCAPCRSELPAFDTVATAAGPSIAMHGVNVGEDQATAASLIAELGIDFAQSVDPSGDITAEVGVATLPATIFATADGEILEVHNGALDAEQLARSIGDLFGVTVDV